MTSAPAITRLRGVPGGVGDLAAPDPAIVGDRHHDQAAGHRPRAVPRDGRWGMWRRCTRSRGVRRADGVERPGASVDPAFAIPTIGLDALVERDERVVELAMDASGATPLLGPEAAGWLRDQRHDFVREVLDRGGVTVASVKVASTDPRSGLGGPRTALASGGVALFLAGAFIQTFSTRATGEPGSNDTMSFEHDSTREGEWGGRRASVRMTTAVDFHVSGSRLEGTVTLTVAATLLDADGNTTGTVTLGMTATVDVDACPDLDGAVHAHFDAETTVTRPATGWPAGQGRSGSGPTGSRAARSATTRTCTDSGSPVRRG